MTKSADLHAKIFDLCEKGETGTLYITTIDNKGCYVVIEDGKVSSISLGRLMGEAFISNFVLLTIKSFTFKDKLIMPMNIQARITSSNDFLEKLGYEMYLHEKVNNKYEEVVQSPAEKAVLMYRGQAVGA